MKKRGITTIKISKSSVNRLSELKIHPRQSYEEVLLKLLDNAKGSLSFSPFKQEDITTIKISKSTVNRISGLKIHPRQSYEEVIVALIGKNEQNN